MKTLVVESREIERDTDKVVYTVCGAPQRETGDNIQQ